MNAKVNFCSVPPSTSKLGENFKKLDESKKWKLSSGRVVEDILFDFAKKCVQDHPACSMIIDPEDKTYIKEGVFTKQEISEIKSTRLKSYTERLPEYLSKFNTSSTEELREQLRIVNGWESHYDIDESYDLDWVKHGIHTNVQLEAFCSLQVVWPSCPPAEYDE
ncbi:hypothetical protein PS6_011732 [Mucor atramentarius]